MDLFIALYTVFPTFTVGIIALLVAIPTLHYSFEYYFTSSVVRKRQARRHVASLKKAGISEANIRMFKL